MRKLPSLLVRLVSSLIESVKVPIRGLMEREPTRVVGVVGAAVAAAAVWLADQLGVKIPPDLMPWVVLILGGAIVEQIRRSVFSPDTTQKIANGATNLPAGTVVDIGAPPAGEVPLEKPWTGEAN